MIIYFNRNIECGFSIQKVFGTITKEVSKSSTLKNLFLPFSQPNPLNILKNGLYVYKNRSKSGINHITGAEHYLTLFLPNRNTIVTVHDVMYINYLKGLKRLFWKLLYIKTLKSASKVTFISMEAQLKTLEHVNLPEDKICVIPNPVGSEFVYSPKKFNDEKPLILHIGTLDRKNLIRTIEALKGIKCQLRIIGKLTDTIKRKLELYDIDYSNGLNLTDEEIVNEYKKCDIVNFISLLEGFGMPIIEGQATGRVVITSNIAPMKNVAGSKSVLVDPYEVEDIKNAYLKIINNSNYRDEIIKEGLINASKYNVETISKQYIGLYDTVMRKNKIN